MSTAQPLTGFAAVDAPALLHAFRECSEEARGDLSQLQLPIGEHILREDISEVLSRALGRQLSGGELSALLKCFLLDVSATIGWPEFERSWAALQALVSGAGSAQAARGGALAAGGQRARAAAAVAASRQHAITASEPRTAQAEIGWQHAAAPVVSRERCEAPGSRYVPLRGSDVTKGGQGSSAATYFGMYLS